MWVKGNSQKSVGKRKTLMFVSSEVLGVQEDSIVKKRGCGCGSTGAGGSPPPPLSPTTAHMVSSGLMDLLNSLSDIDKGLLLQQKAKLLDYSSILYDVCQ